MFWICFTKGNFYGNLLITFELKLKENIPTHIFSSQIEECAEKQFFL